MSTTTQGSSRAAVVVEVGGQRLRLAANATPGHLEGLAAAVNERFLAMQTATRNMVPSTVLALVALDLVDELRTVQRALDEERAGNSARVLAAERRTREVEQMARQAIVDAISEIDRTLAADDQRAGKSANESDEPAPAR